MKKVLFIDRDGTLILEPEDEQVDSLEKLEFYPGVFQWLSRIARELEYELVLVSNQDGLGTDSFPEVDFWPAQNKMINALAKEGIVFSAVHIDRSFPHEKANTRKPQTGMLQQYIFGPYDLANSVVIGDRTSDVQLAKNLGAKGILLGEIPCAEAALQCTRWADIYHFLKGQDRQTRIYRKTKETEVEVILKLDQAAHSNINTGLPFFDHMLDQLARHGGVDLTITAQGDLQVDEHHTIEDVALALGEAFREALGTKKGVQRYGFLLPMDDCLAQVAIDFGGRPYLMWDAQFTREQIGSLPTEMFVHFFKSFSDAAACNLNIKAEGNNEHHKIESIFKAFAQAIKTALSRDEYGSIPSTKGTL